MYISPARYAASAIKIVSLLSLVLTLLSSPSRLFAAPAADMVALKGHVPVATARAQVVSPLSAARSVSLALTLPLHRQAELNSLLQRLYDPKDPNYGVFLTPAQFVDRYCPTPVEYARVMAYARSAGLTVTGTHANRTILDVTAPTAQVERAFGLHLLVYRAPETGRYFFAPDAEPQIPASLGTVVSGVVGLDSAAVWRSHSRLLAQALSYPVPALQAYELPQQTGSGPGGGLTPNDIKAAYNLSGISQNGGGQTLAVFELDGYTASDVAAYENQYGLPNVPLQNVLLDGYSGAAGSGVGEVTLDIELQAALAPGASKILVYEAPNSSTGVVDAYNRIATDNLAKQISTSWGEAENSAPASVRNSENAAFQQMAAQGQSIFAAAGDSGADDNGSNLSVDDPASQPYMVGVGGTSLITNGVGGTYKSETTWNRGSVANGAGGGGISTIWAIPSYQAGLVSAASGGSTAARNVPDVSLNADPNTGYSIYLGGQWYIYGGTSCAAPLWAAFTALVNQQRVANGSGPLGFANPPIYALAQGSRYATDFQDIADGSTNLYYPAVAGYDDATGWGSFNGANLLTDLSGMGAVPASPTGLKTTSGNSQVALTWTGSLGASGYNIYRSSVSGRETLYQTNVSGTRYTDTNVVNGTMYYYMVSAINKAGESAKSSEASAKPQAATMLQLLGNPGFENGSGNPSPWVVTAGVIDNSSYELSHSGGWKAWLDGYGATHTDTIMQQVSIPSTITTATLSFYLHIDTAEPSRTATADTLQVQVRNLSGMTLAVLAWYSNLNAASGYSQKTFDLSAYKGQTVQISLIGKENSRYATSFVVDDFALNAQ